MRRLLLSLLVFVLPAALTTTFEACTSAQNAGPTSGDSGASSVDSTTPTTDAIEPPVEAGAEAGSPSDDATTGGDAGQDADATSEDAAEDAALDAAIPDGACNLLTLAPGQPMVNVVLAAGPVPAQTGGTLVDGTYYLTAGSAYNYDAGTGPSGVIFQGTWVMSGGVTHLDALLPGIVEYPDGGAGPGPESASNSLQAPTDGGTVLLESDGCRAGVLFPGPNGGWQYSASGNTFWIIAQDNPNIVFTFTKQ